MDIVKINFTMTYLTGVAQDWFEMGLNQEDQGIIQDWLSNWNLFLDKLHWHFGLSDSICYELKSLVLNKRRNLV